MSATASPLPAQPSAEAIRSPGLLARRRFARNRLAVFGGVTLAVLVVLCYVTLPWSVRHYSVQTLSSALQPPSAAHPFGTDAIGRDLLARFLVGGAISLAIGLAAAALAVSIGTAVGLLAGYLGGRLDALLMRAVDVLYGLPTILLVILLRVALVPRVTLWLRPVSDNADLWANVLVLLVGIGGVSWLTMARVIRGQVLSLRAQPFMEAAVALGLPHGRVLLRHLLPNVIGPIVVYAALTVPQAILSESFLSFLGLGIKEPLPSWGSLASAGVEAINPIHTRWWLIVWPCAGLSLTLLCLNFLGDGLRDALDPKSTG